MSQSQDMTPEQAAATSGNQIVNPPIDDLWEKFKTAAIYLQDCGTDLDFIAEVRRLQKENPYFIGMVAWHEIVAQETRLRNLSIQSHAEAAAAEGRNARFGAGRRMP